MYVHWRVTFEEKLLGVLRYFCLQKNGKFSGQWELWAPELWFKMCFWRHLLICFSYQYNLHRFISCAFPFDNTVYDGKIIIVLAFTLAEEQ